MKIDATLLKWVTNCLVSKRYTLTDEPEIVVQAPWSTVIRFSTTTEDVYLKQTPPLLFLEPMIMQLLMNQMQAIVPAYSGRAASWCKRGELSLSSTFTGLLRKLAEHSLQEPIT